MIKENLDTINSNIKKNCEIAGRDASDVKLIAVTKTKPIAAVQEAYDLGIRDFGENHVKEILDKSQKLAPDIRWHMIGHLQTNKVKPIISKAYMIHSIDSMKLSDTIDFEARKQGLVVKGLLEVNISGEESKFGFSPNEAIKLLDRLKMYKNLHIMGLMTVAPIVNDPNDNREIFKKLFDLAVDIRAKNIDNVSMSVLSMGMTDDYEIAIQEGATYIRVGTGIFGRREVDK